MLPTVDEKNQVMWCPYCPDKQPVYVYREPDLIEATNKQFPGHNYTLVERCTKCSTLWLCEPDKDNPQHYLWDTYERYGADRRASGPLGLAGITTKPFKEGGSVYIDTKEGAKGHLVVTDELKPKGKNQGWHFLSRLFSVDKNEEDREEG